MQSPERLKANTQKLTLAGKRKIRPWQRVLFRFAGIGEDEWGQFIAIEDMSDSELKEWISIVLSAKDQDSDLYKSILRDVLQESLRRKTNRLKAVNESEGF